MTVGPKPAVGSVAHSLNTPIALNRHEGDSHNDRGRNDGYVPQERTQSVSAQSLRSKASSELRATAPEFVPKLQDGMQLPTVVAEQCRL